MDKTGVIRTPDQRVRVFISSTLTEITAPRRSCSPTAWPWLAARRTGSPSSSRCVTWRSAGRQGHRLAARLRAARPARRCGPGRAALPPGPCGIRGGPSMGPIRRKHARQKVRTTVRTTRPAQVVARQTATVAVLHDRLHRDLGAGFMSRGARGRSLGRGPRLGERRSPVTTPCSDAGVQRACRGSRLGPR